MDFRKRSVKETVAQPPILMLPSREQNYSHPYFAAVFPKAVRIMRESRVLVIVGYSLPPEDALIRFILRQFAEEREDAAGKYLFYVDLVDHKARLTEIFPWLEELKVPKVFGYTGSFADFSHGCVEGWTPRRMVARRKT